MIFRSSISRFSKLQPVDQIWPAAYFYTSYELRMIFTFLRVVKKKKTIKNIPQRDFPGGTMVKNLPANAGDTGSSPGPGRSHMLQSN